MQTWGRLRDGWRLRLCFSPRHSRAVPSQQRGSQGSNRAGDICSKIPLRVLGWVSGQGLLT